MDTNRQRAIERWLVRRGVPQLIEGYATEESMDYRATPLLILWFVVGSLLVWGIREDAPAAVNVLTATLSALFILVALYIIARLRGRPTLRPTVKYDLIDIALFGSIPGIAAGVVFRSAEAAVRSGLTSLLAVALIYAVVGFGLTWIVVWSVTWLVAEFGHLVGLVARTLPLVLILVAFLLFASELWQAATTLNGLELAAVFGLALLAGVAFLAARLGRDLGALFETRAWPVVLEDVVATPAEPLVRGFDVGSPPAPRLSRLERANVTLLVLLSQVLQAQVVGLVVFLFLIVFGIIALPLSVQEAWTGVPPTTVVSFSALSETRTVSFELLSVAMLLSTFASLYFAGFALGDPEYRADALAEILQDVRRSLSVRDVYRAALQGAPHEPVPRESTARHAAPASEP